MYIMQLKFITGFIHRSTYAFFQHIIYMYIYVIKK